MHLRADSNRSPLTAAIGEKEALTIPIAHAEGNYFIDADGLKRLEDNEQVLFRYCDEKGEVNMWSNPNGSTENIAGVMNQRMNVFGMMPHPERACSEDLGNTDGRVYSRRIGKTRRNRINLMPEFPRRSVSLPNRTPTRPAGKISARRLGADQQRAASIYCRRGFGKGGHFGASLGVVELTVALHYVFNTPEDQIVWDVGHQAYGHKILTGRRDRFHTNRTIQRHVWISETLGKPVRHLRSGTQFYLDFRRAGHGRGAKRKGRVNQQSIAVIGDGALTAGLAFEGLNHGGVADTNMLVVLNDNCMSIDPNVGALKEYLTDVTTSRTYNQSERRGLAFAGPHQQVWA